MPFASFLQRLIDRENLTDVHAESLMKLVLTGQATSPQIAAMMVAMRMKGETPDEVVGFARAMRGESIPVQVPLAPGEPLLDTCGTGGDGAGTFNISTVSALVVAGAGVKVAKHGNRSISSQCGSADILEALGVRVDLAPEQAARCIRETGFGFLFAPKIHPAMRHAQEARSQLKMRSVFNLLGPLTNPAGATVQVVGAPSVRAAEIMARALASLGLFRGFVVHGLDGLDEITTTGESLVFEIRGGAIGDHTLTPEDFGVRRASRDQLLGAGREANCAIASRVLEGEIGPARDIVLVNAAAALVAAARAPDFREGVAVAAESIDSGAASQILRKVVEFSNSSASAAGS